MEGLKRILLVEDDVNDVELTLESLREYNLANEVIIARDGEEALEYLYRKNRFEHAPEGQPVVIFLDIKMPRVNGLEVLRIIKNDPDLRLIPVVMVTSSQEEPDLKEAYEMGANAYVVKPVDVQQFMNAIKELGVFWAVFNMPPPGCIKD
ncbi:MAG: response regulator [Candidatus Zhuqueibacterota bacterium]